MLDITFVTSQLGILLVIQQNWRLNDVIIVLEQHTTSRLLFISIEHTLDEVEVMCVNLYKLVCIF